MCNIIIESKSCEACALGISTNGVRAGNEGVMENLVRVACALGISTNGVRAGHEGVIFTYWSSPLLFKMMSSLLNSKK
jgi:hypothetical protein